MNADQIMTRHVVAVEPSTSARDVARCLVKHKISAVPVVDKSGALIGMISESDLVSKGAMDRDERGSWWLEILAEGEKLAPEFLDYVRSGDRMAQDIMTPTVVSVTGDTPIAVIATLLLRNDIKRVPVVEGSKVVGIVSRADLVRTLAHEDDRPDSRRLARSGVR